MPRKTESSRETRILDAAEKAFADFGFDGASMRQIVLAARVNLATVYYYFRSKEGLMEAVIKRRFAPLEQEHLQMLAKLNQQAKGRPLPVEKILEVMFLPPLRWAVAGSRHQQAIMRLIGRIISEPNPRTEDRARRLHDEVRQEFIKALHRSLPKLPLPELQWRLEFVWGALAFLLCKPRVFKKEWLAAGRSSNTKTMLQPMVSFFAAALRTPRSS